MEATSNKTSCNESPEESRAKIKTNLEILLSQNDILPLLKKIRKEKLKSSGNLSLSKYMVKNEKVSKIILIIFKNIKFS
jgi:hypothetical protein